MARIVTIPAANLTVGTTTVDGFTVEYNGKVRQGQVAFRGIARDGRVETRVWALTDMIPVQG